mmetsp:Transcript_22568/g.72225  ORF Transcript_22568/g.72225 Transcript_22568/m.72225 type:complete len:216 (-) Transcript_22568:488-1135(-)
MTSSGPTKQTRSSGAPGPRSRSAPQQRSRPPRRRRQAARHAAWPGAESPRWSRQPPKRTRPRRHPPHSQHRPARSWAPRRASPSRASGGRQRPWRRKGCPWARQMRAASWMARPPPLAPQAWEQGQQSGQRPLGQRRPDAQACRPRPRAARPGSWPLRLPTCWTAWGRRSSCSRREEASTLPRLSRSQSRRGLPGFQCRRLRPSQSRIRRHQRCH